MREVLFEEEENGEHPQEGEYDRISPPRDSQPPQLHPEPEPLVQSQPAPSSAVQTQPTRAQPVPIDDLDEDEEEGDGGNHAAPPGKCHQCGSPTQFVSLGCGHAYCDACIERYYKDAFRPTISAPDPPYAPSGDIRNAMGDKCFKCRGTCCCKKCLKRTTNHSAPSLPAESVPVYARYTLQAIARPLDSLLTTELREAQEDGLAPTAQSLASIPYEHPMGERTTCDLCRTSVCFLVRKCDRAGCKAPYVCVRCCQDLRAADAAKAPPPAEDTDRKSRRAAMTKPELTCPSCLKAHPPSSRNAGSRRAAAIPAHGTLRLVRMLARDFIEDVLQARTHALTDPSMKQPISYEEVFGATHTQEGTQHTVFPPESSPLAPAAARTHVERISRNQTAASAPPTLDTLPYFIAAKRGHEEVHNVEVEVEDEEPTTGCADSDNVIAMPWYSQIAPGAPTRTKLMPQLMRRFDAGIPFVVQDTPANPQLWTPEVMKGLSNAPSIAVMDCEANDWDEVAVDDFFEGFQGRGPLKDRVLKLKDYPPEANFSEVIPRLNQEFEEQLPLPELTHPTHGTLNGSAIHRMYTNPLLLRPARGKEGKAAVTPGGGKKRAPDVDTDGLEEEEERHASYPTSFTPTADLFTLACGANKTHVKERVDPEGITVPCDVGPKGYMAYGRKRKEGAVHESVTRLHMDMCDAVNILERCSFPPYERQRTRFEGTTVKDIYVLTGRPMTSIGAIWHVWRREDMGKLTEFLKRPDVRAMTPYMVRDGATLTLGDLDKASPGHDASLVDAVMDQTYYLTDELLAKCKAECGIEPWTFPQYEHDAVFIPAGCPHQVRNLVSCIKIAIDFMAPGSYPSVLSQVEQLRDLARATSDRGEDKLQGSLMMLCTARECWRALRKQTKQEQPHKEKPANKKVRVQPQPETKAVASGGAGAAKSKPSVGDKATPAGGAKKGPAKAKGKSEGASKDDAKAETTSGAKASAVSATKAVEKKSAAPKKEEMDEVAGTRPSAHVQEQPGPPKARPRKKQKEQLFLDSD